MKLIIDGYNVLKNIVGADFVDEQRRSLFIAQLEKYSHKKNLPIVVVFDGGPFLYTTYERKNGVEVVFSGTKESADDYIKRYVQDVQSEYYLFISSDKELVHYVNYHRIYAVDSKTFSTFLHDALAQHEPQSLVARIKGHIKKLRPEETNKELDALMHQAAEIIVHKAADRIVKEQIVPQAKMSKKDRLRAEKLKKL